MRAVTAPDPERKKDLFEGFFRQHIDQVFIHCVRLGMSRPDAEDACSDIFLVAWQKFDLLSELTDQQAHRWLQTASRFRAMRQYRDRTRLTKLVDRFTNVGDFITASVEDAVFDGIESRYRSSAAHRLAGLLTHLRDTDREVLDLYYLKRQSVAEITAILACSPTALRLRLMRARRALSNLAPPDLLNDLEPSDG